MKSRLLFSMLFLFFVACGGGTTTPATDADNANSDQSVTDEDRTTDRLLGDEDIWATECAIYCPDSVDETKKGFSCRIESNQGWPDSLEPKIGKNDTCGGEMGGMGDVSEYHLAFDENTEPGECIVEVECAPGLTASATIVINEVE